MNWAGLPILSGNIHRHDKSGFGKEKWSFRYCFRKLSLFIYIINEIIWQLKKLSRVLYPDDIIILSEGVIPYSRK